MAERRRHSSAGRHAVAAVLAAAALALGGCGNARVSVEEPERRAVAAETVRQFKEIDVKGRGRISLDEAVAHYTHRFHELDRNRDGVLDASELEPMVPVLRAGTGAELLTKLDNNGDGRISLNEFLILANTLFERSHTRDGTLTLEDASRLPPRQLPTFEPELGPDDIASTAPGRRGRR